MCVLGPGFWDNFEPRKPSNNHSKGYPQQCDPAAEKRDPAVKYDPMKERTRPSSLLNAELDEASLRRLRQHYGPAVPKF